MRLFISGSDNWSMAEYKKLYALCGKKTRIINSYGLTETVIDCSYFETTSTNIENYSSEKSVPIGKPFPHAKILLLDENFDKIPNGESGEIYVGGSGLAIGYFNKPELTANRFLQITIDGEQSLFYKTGDIGRYSSTGDIEFIGRIDNQVKINGIRIELSEIENIMNLYPLIKESLVIMYEDRVDKKLIAYVAVDSNIQLNHQDLRLFMKARLPTSAIPAFFFERNYLPLTSNGKLDRQVLLKDKQSILAKHYVKPRNKIEKKLIKILSKLLEIEKIGLYDDLSCFGINSLLAAQFYSEIEKVFGINVPSGELHKLVNIHEYAILINKLLKNKGSNFLIGNDRSRKKLSTLDMGV